MSKRIITLMMVAVMALTTLVGCGGKETGTVTTDGSTSMEKEEVSLYELSEEVSEVLADAARMKDVSIEVSGTKGIMMGVRRLLYEIICNLCDNAIKYNTSGGHVNISVLEADNEILLTVQDDGIGIAKEYHEKVFERFYRVAKSHSKQSGGTGLGLSIVKHAVQYHDGKLMISSELGKGTSISVAFKKSGVAKSNEKSWVSNTFATFHFLNSI